MNSKIDLVAKKAEMLKNEHKECSEHIEAQIKEAKEEMNTLSVIAGNSLNIAQMTIAPIQSRQILLENVDKTMEIVVF